jgi:hypothetical protein
VTTDDADSVHGIKDAIEELGENEPSNQEWLNSIRTAATLRDFASN